MKFYFIWFFSIFFAVFMASCTNTKPTEKTEGEIEKIVNQVVRDSERNEAVLKKNIKELKNKEQSLIDQDSTLTLNEKRVARRIIEKDFEEIERQALRIIKLCIKQPWAVGVTGGTTTEDHVCPDEMKDPIAIP